MQTSTSNKHNRCCAYAKQHAYDRVSTGTVVFVVSFPFRSLTTRPKHKHVAWHSAS